MTKIDNFKLFVKNNPNLITYVRNNTKESETKKTSKFSDILDMAKNIDTNKLQDSISSVQKAIGLIGDMLVKDKTPGIGSTYNPRPLYRRFDD